MRTCIDSVHIFGRSFSGEVRKSATSINRLVTSRVNINKYNNSLPKSAPIDASLSCK